MSDRDKRKVRGAPKMPVKQPEGRRRLSPRALAGRWGVGLATAGAVIGGLVTYFL